MVWFGRSSGWAQGRRVARRGAARAAPPACCLPAHAPCALLSSPPRSYKRINITDVSACLSEEVQQKNIFICACQSPWVVARLQCGAAAGRPTLTQRGATADSPLACRSPACRAPTRCPSLPRATWSGCAPSRPASAALVSRRRRHAHMPRLLAATAASAVASRRPGRAVAYGRDAGTPQSCMAHPRGRGRSHHANRRAAPCCACSPHGGHQLRAFLRLGDRHRGGGSRRGCMLMCWGTLASPAQHGIARTGTLHSPRLPG